MSTNNSLWTVARRLLLSFAGGVFVLILVFTIAGILGALPALRLKWIEDIYFWVALWPQEIFIKLFPPPPQCPDCGPDGRSVIATVLFDMLMYSLLIYIILWWRSKRNRIRY